MYYRLGLFLILIFATYHLNAGQAGTGTFSVKDDKGRMVTLDKPARRIISLAPHLTEMLFAAGAGEYIIGTVKYSDFPEAAKKIPRIGSYVRSDLEAIVSLKPDLVVAWQSSNNQKQIDKLIDLGIPVFIDEPRRLTDITATIERLGVLTGTSEQAQRHNAAFMAKYVALEKKYKKRTKISLFYQFWNEPLMTLSGKHIVGEVMQLCGAKNVFHDAFGLAVKVDVEAVLKENPQVIVAAGMDGVQKKWLADWRQWKMLAAVKNNHLYSLNPDHLNRAGPRILLGAQALCEAVERARN